MIHEPYWITAVAANTNAVPQPLRLDLYKLYLSPSYCIGALSKSLSFFSHFLYSLARYLHSHLQRIEVVTKEKEAIWKYTWREEKHYHNFTLTRGEERPRTIIIWKKRASYIALYLSVSYSVLPTSLFMSVSYFYFFSVAYSVSWKGHYLSEDLQSLKSIHQELLTFNLSFWIVSPNSILTSQAGLHFILLSLILPPYPPSC